MIKIFALTASVTTTLILQYEKLQKMSSICVSVSSCKFSLPPAKSDLPLKGNRENRPVQFISGNVIKHFAFLAVFNFSIFFVPISNFP